MATIEEQKATWVAKGKHYCEFCEEYYPEYRKKIREGKWPIKWADGSEQWACAKCCSNDVANDQIGLECDICDEYSYDNGANDWHVKDLRNTESEHYDMDYSGYNLFTLKSGDPYFICNKCLPEWLIDREDEVSDASEDVEE